VFLRRAPSGQSMLNPLRISLWLLVVAAAAWCLYLLVPTHDWASVVTCVLIPGSVLAYAGSLAKRGSPEADPVLWLGVAVTLSYVYFAQTVAAT
jgi:hypothetical protein